LERGEERRSGLYNERCWRRWGEATEWMATRAEAEEKGKLRRRTKWGSKSRSKKEKKTSKKSS
jgi:hypothetical protein